MAVDFGKILTDPRVIATGITLGGSILEGMGENKRSEADRELQQRLAIANFLSGEQGREQAGAATALSSLGGPFGFNEDLQKQRIRAALLGNVRNASITAPPDVEAVRGRLSGGFRVPEGGFDTRALSDSALSEGARNYFTALSQVNPNGTTPDFGAFGLDSAASDRVESARRGYADDSSARQQQILQYLGGGSAVGANGMPTKDGPGLNAFNDQIRASAPYQQWMQQNLNGRPMPGTPGGGLSDSERRALQQHLMANGVQFARGMEIDPAGNLNQDHGADAIAGKIGRFALSAAPIAANFIPGVGPLASAAIAAGASGARTAIDGGGIGDVLKSAALGGGMSYLSGKIPGNPFRIPRAQAAAPVSAGSPDLIQNYLRGRQPLEALR